MHVRILSLFLLIPALWLGFASAAEAGQPQLKKISATVGESQVAYPQLEGMADTALQQAINDDIILRGNIAKHLVTLGTLQPGGWGLVVEYEAFLAHEILSVTLQAKGEMPNGREGQAYTALCYDLQTGKAIQAEDLFVDPASAALWMEEALSDSLLEELSGYLESSELSPLPLDNFALDADGVTFFYPMDQFFLVSGYCGAGQFYYEELGEWLNREGILGRLIEKPALLSDKEAKEKIVAMVSSGRLPHVPVAIGDPMPELVEVYRLLREPDQYPAGKYYQMEAPMFRQVLVLSDALTSGYEHSVVEGLQSTRAELFGIKAGETTRERWREILGSPHQQATFDESLAYDYGIPPGESDFYTFGGIQLRLHADQNGVLHSIRVTR